MPLILEIEGRLKEVFTEKQAIVLANVISSSYDNLVKVSDFNELKGIVRNIGIKVGELAEAQKETQKEIGRLDRIMQELAEAQKESRKEIGRLDRTMQELAKAQKRTEIEIRALTVSHEALKKEVGGIKKQVGGLSHTVGFRLEDEAFNSLPGLLKRDFGFIIEDRLKRQYILDNEGKYIEINIIGSAKRNGKKLTIIGEAKSQLSKNDVDDFVRKKLKRLEGLYEETFPLLITYMTSQPDVEEYAKNKGIALYYSYDF